MSGDGKRKIAACYRAQEPIQNFKLRVKVVQQRSSLAELLDGEGDSRDSNYLEEETRVFGWQEKVFNPCEVDFYKDEANCTTECRRDYHRRIREEDLQGSLLYSYTENDFYLADDAVLTKRRRSRLSIKNESAVPALQNRKPFGERFNRAVVDESPTDARIRANHYVYTERSAMHVLADLGGKHATPNAGDPNSETLLCTIAYDRARKILKIDPDFTNGEDRYTVANGCGIKFDYWLEDASEKPTELELQQQQEDLRREIHQRVAHKETEIPLEMQHVFHNTLRIFVNLEIVSANGFSYDGLFITYCIDMPRYWSTTQNEKLSGRTQKSRVRDKMAYFGYVTDIYLDFSLNETMNSDMLLSSWPRLLLSVGSLDNWTRYRTEGYGTLVLPSSPGSYEFTVNTWRFTGSIVDSLRRFFTGGTYELADITYCGIPAAHDDRMLDKLNLTVIPSGSIKINVNVAHQGHKFMTDFNTESSFFGKQKTDTLITNTQNVLEQFKAARERMLQLRTLEL